MHAVVLYRLLGTYAQACALTGAPAAILLDTKGPEIRTAMLHSDFAEGLPIETGDDVVVHAVGEQYTTFQGYRAPDGTLHIGLSYGGLAQSVRAGNKVRYGVRQGSIVLESWIAVAIQV